LCKGRTLTYPDSSCEKWNGKFRESDGADRERENEYRESKE
jgi:hypothetical protein